MRKLHLVGFTSDHEGLVFAGRRGAKTGSFVIALDKELLDQIDASRRSDRGRAPVAEVPRRSKIESMLSPREMQAFLRAGRTVEDVAAEAGVSVEWVERFAAPILAEQASAISRAGAATLLTPRRGLSGRPLTAAVLRNLAIKGIRLTDDDFATSWSAQLTVDTEWIIRFRYWSRGHWLEAEWVFDTGSGMLLANNRLGSELGFVEPERRAAPAAKEAPPTPVYPRRTRPTPDDSYYDDEVPARRSASRPASNRFARSSSRPLAPRQAAKKAAVKKAAVKKAAVKKAAPRKAVVAKKAAVKKAAPRKAVVAKKAAVKKAAPRKAVVAKKAAVKKAAPRKAVAAKKAPVKKAPAKKAAPRKAVPRAAARTASRQSTPTSPAVRAPAPPVVLRPAPAVQPAPGRRPRPLVAARFDKQAEPHVNPVPGPTVVESSSVLPFTAPPAPPLRPVWMTSGSPAPRRDSRTGEVPVVESPPRHQVSARVIEASHDSPGHPYERQRAARVAVRLS